MSPNTTVGLDQISKEMCGMNETMLEKVFTKVVDQMNIGTLLKDVGAFYDFSFNYLDQICIAVLYCTVLYSIALAGNLLRISCRILHCFME